MNRTQRIWVVIPLLMMLLGNVVSAGASSHVGFSVDCSGAYGFGQVPDTGVARYDWFVRMYDPGTNSGTGVVTDLTWSGNVGAGQAFNPVVNWPITPSQGTTQADSYYWVDIWDFGTGEHVYHAEGHFDCPPPPPPPGDEGCTPGFWQGKNNGRLLWNEADDPDFEPAGGNPFSNDILFNDFFTPVGSLDGLTMLDLVRKGGGSDHARKAARSLVAAYLNASHSDVGYPFTTAQLEAMWDDAVANGTLLALHTQLDLANNLGCSVD